MRLGPPVWVHGAFWFWHLPSWGLCRLLGRTLGSSILRLPIRDVELRLPGRLWLPCRLWSLLVLWPLIGWGLLCSELGRDRTIPHHMCHVATSEAARIRTSYPLVLATGCLEPGPGLWSSSLGLRGRCWCCWSRSCSHDCSLNPLLTALQLGFVQLSDHLHVALLLILRFLPDQFDQVCDLVNVLRQG